MNQIMNRILEAVDITVITLGHALTVMGCALGLSFHTFSKVGTDFKLYSYEKACAEHPDEDHYLRLIH